MTFLPPIFILLVFVQLAAAQALSPSELIDKSIEYHDPEGKWGSGLLELQFEETRPGGTTRYSNVKMDIPGEYFSLWQKNGDTEIVRTVTRGECSHQYQGSTDIPAEVVQKMRLTCERSIFMRDYYTYLWGMPMKLKDPGTILGDEVRETDFFGTKALEIKVTYDPEVGGDTWYFYFHPKNYKLVGYRFYHDESKNDGEYIILKKEAKVAGMRLPKSRTWYTHKEDRLLGTDTLVRGN